jgi:hypothetical protein
MLAGIFLAFSGCDGRRIGVVAIEQRCPSRMNPVNRSMHSPRSGVLALAVGLCLVSGVVEALPLQSCSDSTPLEGAGHGDEAGEAMRPGHTAPVAVVSDSRGGMSLLAATHPAVRSGDVQRLADRATGRTTIAEAVTFGFDVSSADFLDLRFPGGSGRGRDEAKKISFPETRTWGMGELGTAPALRRR